MSRRRQKSKKKGNKGRKNYSKQYKKQQKQGQKKQQRPTKKETKQANTTAINSANQTWCFSALDTLFFRESRPMDSLGKSELGSLFPPSIRTLMGAVRTALGEANDIDWREYRQQKQQHPLTALIGYGDDLADLCFSGVWIHKNKKRLYPAPQNIMKRTRPDGRNMLGDVFFLTISDKLTHCDLGKIRLPELKKENTGSKPLDNIWLTESEFQAVLAGHPPQLHRWIKLKDLLVEEPRIGIARDNNTRGVEKGKLYQTKHVRLIDDVELAIDISGLESDKWNITAPAFIRLGGEGRISAIDAQATPTFVRNITLQKNQYNQYELALYLLTPLLIEQSNDKDWQPLPDFTKEVINQQTVWTGTINDIVLTLHTAIMDKAHQEGGWDLVKNKPKAVQSYIPAGSVFYCTCESDDPEKIINALHGKQIGNEKTMGRGIMAIGKWV